MLSSPLSRAKSRGVLPNFGWRGRNGRRERGMERREKGIGRSERGRERRERGRERKDRKTRRGGRH